MCEGYHDEKGLTGWITIANYEHSTNWTEEAIDCLIIISEIITNAFERKKYEDKIQNLQISLEQQIDEKTNESYNFV